MRTGKLPESALKRSVLKQVHQGEGGKCAAVGADCAFFVIPDGRIAAWCSQAAVVSPEGDWKEAQAAVIKCANNLAASGAKPLSVQIALMLPESFEEPQVRELMEALDRACGSVGAKIDGGDTNISSAVLYPVVTVTALGLTTQERRRGPASAAAGQDIVVSKWIGLEGTAALARAEREALLARYPAYLVETAQAFEELLCVTPEAEIALESGVGAMHDLSQGGVFGALWELAEGSGLGLTVDLRKIPIRQETVEVCELCSVNPYEMRSAGSLLMTADDGAALVKALERAGIPAAVIGKMTKGNDRTVINGEEIRYLDRPAGADAIAEAVKKRDRETDKRKDYHKGERNDEQ